MIVLGSHFMIHGKRVGQELELKLPTIRASGSGRREVFVHGASLGSEPTMAFIHYIDPKVNGSDAIKIPMQVIEDFDQLVIVAAPYMGEVAEIVALVLSGQGRTIRADAGSHSIQLRAWKTIDKAGFLVGEVMSVEGSVYSVSPEDYALIRKLPSRR